MGAWEDAVASAMARANATTALLDRKLGSADLNREVEAQRSFGTKPLRPTAQSEVNFQDLGPKMPTHDHPIESDLHGFQDQGEATPGAAKAQSLRARAIARSMIEKRSSVKATSTTPKPSAPAKAAKPASIVTDTGSEAGAIKTMGKAPADLGRATAKVLKGTYGDVSPKTAAKVSESFSSRATASLRGLGSTLGAIGNVGLAAKAASAFRGMKEGKVVNPLSFDTHEPQEGEEVLTIRGKQKYHKLPGKVES